MWKGGPEKGSPGPDKFSGRVMKHHAQHVESVLDPYSSTVQQLWKHSTVIPILRKAQPKLGTTYDPLPLPP